MGEDGQTVMFLTRARAGTSAVALQRDGRLTRFSGLRLGTRVAIAYAVFATMASSVAAGASAYLSPGDVRGSVPLLAASDRTRLLTAVALAVLASLLVLVVFIVASMAIIRLVRGFHTAAGRHRAASTPSDDVWSKHKLPDDWDEDDDEEDDEQLPVY